MKISEENTKKTRNLETSMQELQNRHNKEIKSLKSELESRKKQNDELEQQIKDDKRKLQEEINHLNQEKDELHSRLVKIEGERLNENKVQVQLQLKKNQSTTKQKEELNDVIQNLERETSDQTYNSNMVHLRDHDKVQLLKSEIESLKLKKDELERCIRDNIKILEEQTDSLKHGEMEHLNMNHMIQERQQKVDEEPLKDKTTEETYLINEPTTKRNEESDKKIQSPDMEKYEPHNRQTQIDGEQLNEKKIQELQLMNKQIQQRNEELEKQIQYLENENKQLQSRQSFTEDLKGEEKEIQRLKTDIESLINCNQEAQVHSNKIIQNLQEEIKALEQEKNRHKVSEEIKSNEVRSLKSEIESQTKRKMKFEQEINRLNKSLEEQEGNVREIVVKNEELNKKLNDMSRQFHETKTSEGRLSARIKEQDNVLISLKAEKDGIIKSFNAQIKELQQKKENQRTNLLSIIQERDDTLSAIKKEKDDLQNRLSSIAGEKLTKGNPAITDLGDPNRPMKIGERYGELYDNEWTDAIECTSDLKQLFTALTPEEFEKLVIHHLYRILTQCYQECLKLSHDQLLTIAQVFLFDTSKDDTDIESLPVWKEVAAIRRQNADKFAKELYQNKILVENIVRSDWQYPLKSEDLMRRLMNTSFYEKCLQICWSMAIQNPVMLLSDDIPPGTVYDRNIYKEFVHSGDKVDYVVWPALFLHKGGPLLFKGVVQAYK